MSDFQVPTIPVAPPVAGLTQMERVICTFTAPSKTFNDIKRSTSWWLPFVLSAIFGYALFAGITTKITWSQVVENNMKRGPAKQSEQFDKLPADQKATQLKVAEGITEGSWVALPILSLIIVAVIAGVQLATINFGFGGKATFWQVFSVTWYAGLPGLFKFLLGTIAIFAGLDRESFNLNNFAGTNIGYYLNPLETNKALYTLATAIDPIAIWSVVLSAIGLSIVAGTKRSTGYAVAFGWWGLMTLIFVGIAAAFS